MSDDSKKPLIRKLTGGADTELAVRRLRREEHALGQSFTRDHPLGATRSYRQGRQVRSSPKSAANKGVYKLQGSASLSSVPALSLVSRWGTAHTGKPADVALVPPFVPATYTTSQLVAALYTSGFKELAARVVMELVKTTGLTHASIFGPEAASSPGYAGDVPDHNFKRVMSEAPVCYWVDDENVLQARYVDVGWDNGTIYTRQPEQYFFTVPVLDFKTFTAPTSGNMFRTAEVTFVKTQAKGTSQAYAEDLETTYPTCSVPFPFTWNFTINLTGASPSTTFGFVTPIRTAPMPTLVQWVWATGVTATYVDDGPTYTVTIKGRAQRSTGTAGPIVYDLAAAQDQTGDGYPLAYTYQNINTDGANHEVFIAPDVFGYYNSRLVVGDKLRNMVYAEPDEVATYAINSPDQRASSYIIDSDTISWNFYRPFYVGYADATTASFEPASFRVFTEVAAPTVYTGFGPLTHTIVGENRQAASSELYRDYDIAALSYDYFYRCGTEASVAGEVELSYYSRLGGTTLYVYRDTYINGVLIDRSRYVSAPPVAPAKYPDPTGPGIFPANASFYGWHTGTVLHMRSGVPPMTLDGYGGRGAAPGYPVNGTTWYARDHLYSDRNFFTIGMTFSASPRVGVLYMDGFKYPLVYAVPDGTIWGYFGTMMTSFLSAATNAAITTAITTCKNSVNAYSISSPDVYDDLAVAFKTAAADFLNPLAIDGAKTVDENKALKREEVKAFLQPNLTVARNRSGIVTDVIYFITPSLYAVV